MRNMILAFALLALASTSGLAQEAPCTQAQLAGRWLLSSTHGNSCTVRIARSGALRGRCEGPFWPPEGGPLSGTFTIQRNCVISGENSGDALGGPFGPLVVGPAALAQDRLTITGVTETGDGDQRHMFTMTRLR